MASPPEQLMQCMEVWGGNQAADNGVVMAGLDAWVYSKPHGGSVGGGDVYYVSSCATNRILRLLVADVSGHGQAVQNVAVELRGMMRRYVNHLDHIQFVRSMNRQFAALAQAGCFATAVVSTYFAPTGRLTLCNAGHPPPLLYRGATRQWTYLDDSAARPGPEPINLPLGILDLADYQTFDVPLSVGDMVLCYTDSLVESRGPDGELLGQDRLLELVRGLPIDEPAGLIPALLAAVASQSDGNLTADDVTALLFCPNSSGRRRTSIRQQFTAVARILKAIGGSLRPGGQPVPWPDLKLANIGGAVAWPLHRFWMPRKPYQEPRQ